MVLCELCDQLLRRNGSSGDEVIGMMRSKSHDVFDASDAEASSGAIAYGNIISFPTEANITPAGIKPACPLPQAVDGGAISI